MRCWIGSRRGFVAGLFVGAVACVSAEARTIYVNGTTGNDAWTGRCEEWDGGTCGPKRTIRAGVEATVDGDEVVVADGSYLVAGGDLTIAHPLNIHSGSGSQTCSIEVPADDIVFAETSEGALFHGFSIRADRTVMILRGARSGVTISACDFPGSGIDLQSGSHSVLDCSFTRATINRPIQCIAASLRMERCSVRECSVYGTQVMICSGPGASVYLADCDFVRNVASTPVAIACPFRIERCHFLDNTSIGSASMQFTDYLEHDSELLDCLFSGNYGRSTLGGAGFVSGVRVARCEFAFNSGGLGGALFVSDRTEVFDCVFYGNYASETGGAIYSELFSFGEPILVKNCTLYGNGAGTRTGGMRVLGSVRASNNVMWGNSDHFGGERAQLDVCCDYDLRYNCIQDWSGALDGVGNFSESPGFVDVTTGDFHLAAGSPCIGTGDPFEQGSGRTDFDGEPRVMGGRVDVGADEFTDRPFLFGDANCDAVRDNGDIDSFVLALLDADAWLAANPGCLIGNADANGDGTVDNGDIDWFVAYLLGPP